ncbi:MAG: hypothetical protein ACXWDO_03295 [Bacteroidia bacterium]
MKKLLFYLVVILLTGFGLLTLFLSASVIFDLFHIREKEGNYVPFVVWANFVASLLYLVSAYGLVKAKSWTYKLLLLAALVLFIAFIGLIIHIQSGGIYETKTIYALIFRTLITIGFAYFSINKNKKSPIN